MRKWVFLAVALAILAISLCFSPVFASQNSIVGVKAGDWIKYSVAEKADVAGGSIDSEYNITWAEMNITAVDGPVITVNVLTQYGNGTLLPENDIHLNVQTGHIGDGFFVPLNMTQGDQYSTEYEGVINIAGDSHEEAAGASRTVIVGLTSESIYHWDKQTGIMISATSTLPGCVMYTTTSATNLWQPQILGLNKNLFYLLVIALIAAVAVIAAAVAVAVRRRK